MLLEIALLVLIFLLGLNPKFFFWNQIDSGDTKVLRLLWIFHLLICLFFYFYVLSNGGDALTYWNDPKENLQYGFADYWSLGVGTYFMYLLNFFPSNILGFSFFTGSVLYALLGYFGFVYLYILFKKRIKYNSKILGIPLFPTLLFLPNLHFWSCNIGKDTLLFFCIGMILYAMEKPKKHLIKIVFALALSYLVRPHIAAYLVVSFITALLISSNLKLYKKVFLFSVLVFGFVLIYDNLVSYLRIESFDLETISTYSDSKVEKLSRSHTGSSVNISSYPFPLKVFTFLYRPLFFDGPGIFGFLASIENVVLLILSVKLIVLNPIKIFRKGDFLLKGAFIFLLLGACTFSLILGNLGIMLRQKNMFIPALLFICLWAYSYDAEQRLQRNRNIPETEPNV